MNKARLLLTVGVLSLGFLAANAAYAKGATSEDFVKKASIAGKFEIDSSKLALDKSNRQDVRTFAQRMIDDHTKASDELKETISTANINLMPATALDSKHQKMMDKLSNADADKFDKEYIKIQEDAHKEAVKLFDKYSKKGDNEDLRSFAADTLPIMQSHLEHIKKLKSEYKNP